jgi:hypothetical protein
VKVATPWEYRNQYHKRRRLADRELVATVIVEHDNTWWDAGVEASSNDEWREGGADDVATAKTKADTALRAFGWYLL